MLKRLMVAAALAAGLSVGAQAQDAPKTADDCFKNAIDLAKSAEDKKLGDDKLAKVEELLDQDGGAVRSAEVRRSRDDRERHQGGDRQLRIDSFRGITRPLESGPEAALLLCLGRALHLSLWQT